MTPMTCDWPECRCFPLCGNRPPSVQTFTTSNTSPMTADSTPATPSDDWLKGVRAAADEIEHYMMSCDVRPRGNVRDDTDYESLLFAIELIRRLADETDEPTPSEIAQAKEAEERPKRQRFAQWDAYGSGSTTIPPAQPDRSRQ